MNEAVKNKMRRFVAGAMAVIMVLTALLALFVRPKAEEATQQIPILNETIVGTCHCPQNVRKTWAVEKNVGRMQKWQTYVVCRPA